MGSGVGGVGGVLKNESKLQKGEKKEGKADLTSQAQGRNFLPTSCLQEALQWGERICLDPTLLLEPACGNL